MGPAAAHPDRADRLVLPAPWALGLMLGLKDRVCQPWPIRPGTVVEVIQERAKGDLDGACKALNRAARARGLASAPSLAPWSLFIAPGSLGQVRVTACEPLRPPASGYVISVADPQPAWRDSEVRT